MCVQDKTVENTVRLSPKQLDRVAPVLDKIIHKIVDERQKGSSDQTFGEEATFWPCFFCNDLKMTSSNIFSSDSALIENLFGYHTVLPLSFSLCS